MSVTDNPACVALRPFLSISNPRRMLSLSSKTNSLAASRLPLSAKMAFSLLVKPTSYGFSLSSNCSENLTSLSLMSSGYLEKALFYRIRPPTILMSSSVSPTSSETSLILSNNVP